MKDFDNISEHLDSIIDTTRGILEVQEQREEKLSTIKHLMEKRERQLQVLYQTEIDKRQMTDDQKEKFRDFFNRFYLLDKKMGRFLDELSLHYTSSLREVEQQKKAKQAYSEDMPAGTFLNTTISG